MTRALLAWGGWEGHEPETVAERLAAALRSEGVEVDLTDEVTDLGNPDLLARADLVVPVWTLGDLRSAQLRELDAAVSAGLGLAGCHGTSDAFRERPEFHFMLGGWFAAHPGDLPVTYNVHFADPNDVITKGMTDFEVTTEQYYLHVDPSNHVLATTNVPVAAGPHAANGPFEMPVAWTRRHGEGRVFYCSLGHSPEIVDDPRVLPLLVRGFLWAAKAELR
jgi:type 1 glutamine amidotransferase